jgi:hypothetical protein
MAMYQNKTNRIITIFLQNSIPVKFQPGEHKILAQEGLERQYGKYLRRVEPTVKEGKETKGKKEEKGLISEVKQPAPNKELTKEPVEESAKTKKKLIKETPKKIDEGYSPWQSEQTIATSSKQ